MPFTDDIKNNLPDVARKVALPAILAGAGTGALSGFMSSRSRPAGETPGQRRRRILRNAMVGTLLGGVAGAALPTGLKTLTDPFFGKPQGVSPAQRTLGFGISNAAPLATLAGGGVYLARLRKREKERALQHIFGLLKGKNLPMEGSLVTNKEQVIAALESNLPNVRSMLASQSPSSASGVKNLLHANQLLGEAGYHGNLPPAVLRRKQIPLVKSYLRSLGSMPGFGLPEVAARSVGGEIAGRSTSPIAEAYLKYLRPGMERAMGRGSWATRLGLLGGGVLAAHGLQNTITGN